MLVGVSVSTNAGELNKQSTIVSGVPWFDQNNREVSARGACIVKEGGKYYLFGEYKTDSANVFAGFSCYSSTDLYNWKFERMALPVQASGKLGPNRVGERVKVMKCPTTGEFVMYMHADDLNYKDQFVGYATSKTINGVYTFQGPLLFNGKPVKKWDMGTFQDTDGKGYVITHSGNLFQLTDDYKSVSAQIVKDMTPQCEAPVIFKRKGVYYWIGSRLTSWEKNDNYYFTASSLAGPWKERGLIAPEGTLTWNSQSTFVLPIIGAKDTTYLFMGDRWSFPRQYSAATYVWQPLTVKDSSLSIPQFKQSWTIDTQSGKWSEQQLTGKFIADKDTVAIQYQGKWSKAGEQTSSDATGATFTVKFTGTQAGFYGQAGPAGGYAKVTLYKKGKKILDSQVDMYCKYPETSLRFLSPKLEKANYKLVVTVIGEHGIWKNKKGNVFGSTGNRVSLDKILIK
jgi:hypothetical protein